MKTKTLPKKKSVLIDFQKDVKKKTNKIILLIEERIKDLAEILLTYESYEVAKDEISRTLDLLENIDENKEYFKLRVGPISSFLPRNQPLYAFSCFIIIPSLMAKEVHFRIPQGMKDFFPKLMEILDISILFPNIIVSPKTRIEFLKERSALLVNPKTGETKSVTDAVIFTGTSVHADQLRMVFDKETLFISNGSGHNPIVVSKDADIDKAVEAVTDLCLYNQGQDCAAPNAILVHKNIYQGFMRAFQYKLSKIKVGEYSDRLCRVGPLNDPKHLNKVGAFLIENREWINKKTKGVIRTAEAIIEPTILSKPLKKGGNYEETFAPIIFIQKYDKDKELALYFENKEYENNAMYISLYGNSVYINDFVESAHSSDGRRLHRKETFLHNTHLHEVGIERGTQPYGGYGYGASSVSINGEIIPKPTLPQRDIYELVALPILNKKLNETFTYNVEDYTQIRIKNVEKLLKIHPTSEKDKKIINEDHNNAYFDLNAAKKHDHRYVKIEKDNVYYLLNTPNIEYGAHLNEQDVYCISLLKELLNKKSRIPLDEFIFLLYSIPKKDQDTEVQNKYNQYHFFKTIYHLLFGGESGPKLGIFLWEADEALLNTLLTI